MSERSRHRGGWPLAFDFPLLKQPESEWGTLPVFARAVRDFAHGSGYQFVALHGAHPEDFSALAFAAYLWEARLHERTVQSLLIETFTQFNPTAALRSSLLPLWMPFNCMDSLEFLSRMARFLPDRTPALLSLVPSFSPTPDVAGAATWHEILNGDRHVHWIGTTPYHYPVDLASLFDYLPQLQAWTRQHPGMEPRPELTPDDLQELIYYMDKDGEKLLRTLLTDLKIGESRSSRICCRCTAIVPSCARLNSSG